MEEGIVEGVVVVVPGPGAEAVAPEEQNVYAEEPATASLQTGPLVLWRYVVPVNVLLF